MVDIELQKLPKKKMRTCYCWAARASCYNIGIVLFGEVSDGVSLSEQHRFSLPVHLIQCVSVKSGNYVNAHKYL